MRRRIIISFLTIAAFLGLSVSAYCAPSAFGRNVRVPTSASSPDVSEAQSEVLEEQDLLDSYYLESGDEEEEGYRSGIASPVSIANNTLANEDSYVEGQFFIKFKNPSDNPKMFDNLSAEDVFSATPDLARIVAKYDIRPTNIKRLFSKLTNSTKENIRNKAAALKNTFIFISYSEDSVKLIEELSALPESIYAERIPKIKAFYTPDDPEYSQQWHLPQIQASAAWDIYNANTDNSEVVIAVVDDAVKLGHEDLNSNIWVNPNEIPNNGIDDDANGYIDDVNGYDVAEDDNDPNPPANATNTYFMHGTHVAGIAAAVSNNTIGVSSISGAGQNKVKIMAVKTKEDSSPGGSLEATFEGLEYAIAADANVINMSWGGSGYSRTYQDLFIVAHSLGVTLVAAAGNDFTESYKYPASYLYVVSVGATDQSDQKATFSNYGYQIDVMAPGIDILSTLPVNDSSYGNLSGTSMASPLVAGLAGLIRSYNDALTPHQVEILIEENCDNIDAQNLDYMGKIGAGRINANNIMQDLQGNNIPEDEDFTAINSYLTSSCWGVTDFGDYDNDGDLDILVTGWLVEGPGSSLDVTKVLRNDGLVNGEWEFVDINAGLPGRHYSDVMWADYDNDGYLDITLTGSNKIELYHNDGLVGGQWTFTKLSNFLVYTQPGHSAWGDYDNDGDLDLLVANFGPDLYRNDGLVNGQFHFTRIWGAFPQQQTINAVAWGDYDNDGDLDVLSSGAAVYPQETKIYRNDGQGTGNQWQFTDINANFPSLRLTFHEWGDYDNDGDLDILLSGLLPSSPGSTTGDPIVKIYRNEGSGQFIDINAGLTGVYVCDGASNVSWGDYDNDGDLDVALLGKIAYDSWNQRMVSRIFINDNGILMKIMLNLLAGLLALLFGEILMVMEI